MSQPVLSICIATRNRAAFIGETIDSFIQQITDGVEIVVLDGGSTDATPTIMADFAARYPFVRYLRKETNGGVDRDYDEAVGIARGRYCWLMSDDDLPTESSVEYILSKLTSSPALVVLNAEVRNFDMSQVLDANRLGWSADRVYTLDEIRSLFRDTSAYLTYIGAVVIRRDVWLSRRREPYFGSCFIHVGVIFQAPLPAEAIACARPLVSIRFGNTQWRPREFEIRMFLWTDLVWSLSPIPEDDRRALYPSKPWRSVKSLFFYRAKGTYGLDEYRKYLPQREASLLFRLQAMLIAVFPGLLANIIGLVVCRLPYRDSNIHLLDMRASRFYLPNWIENRRRGLDAAGRRTQS